MRPGPFVTGAGLTLAVVFVACEDSGTQLGVADGGRLGGAAGSNTAGAGGLTTSDAGPPAPTGNHTLGMPLDPKGWMGAPMTGAGAPTIVYPSDQTRFPRNIYRTLFQWRATGQSEYRLTFAGPGTTVTVFTDGKHALCNDKPGAACWEADEQSWFLIASGNAGKTATWTVDGLDGTTRPPTVRRSASVTLGFSSQNVPGAIFYWSTTSAGIRRANVAASTPEDYITGKPPTTYDNPQDSVKCVACHVVSRDGKYMVAPVGADSGGGLWIMEVTKTAPPTPLVKNIPDTQGHGFATISPDNARVVVAWGGKMWAVDRVTGMRQEDLPLGMLEGTQPDWSPDGSQVVFATGKGDSPGGASLATMSWTNGAWGAPKTILMGAGTIKPPKGMMMTGPGGSNLFPMHSPDSKWVAFSRGKGGHGDDTAQLWVMPSAGGTPVELLNANRVVSNALGDGQTENNQPTWAPPGDLFWVAFNSKRAYGVVLNGGSQQIWVAAIDPARLGSGQDPSFPAFRLQFQGLEEDNHRAFWTLDVRYPDPPKPTPNYDGGMCVPANQACMPMSDMCCDPLLSCLPLPNNAGNACQQIIL